MFLLKLYVYVMYEQASLGSHGVTGSSSVNPIFTYTSVFIKQEAKRWDVDGNHIVKVTKEMAEKIHQMTLYLKRKGPIQSKDAFVALTKDLIMSSQTITQFVKVIADYCLDKHSTKEMYIISEQILTVTNQLTILSSVNAVTPMCKSSDEILVKNAQSLLQTVIQVIQAVETACIKGIRQPEHNSEAAKAASLCIDWKKKLLIHRAQEQMNTETDNLGLRKTSLHLAAPSLTLPISVLKGYK
ncbi:vinculin-like [Trichomycterus rosablanca]|uniref:vinculin-like n=1 Tax=Trichomycterus rosablanca TaxID=2290929 RepID=UPI002F350A7C